MQNIDVVFFTTIVLGNIFALILFYTTQFKLDKLLLLTWLIPQLYMLYGMYKGDPEIRNKIHDNVFFYFIAITPFLFQDKYILLLLLIVYVMTLSTRYIFNRCMFVTEEAYKRKKSSNVFSFISNYV